MVRVIIDTNFLLLPHQYHIDIFSEIARIVDGKAELAIIDRTEDELAHLVQVGTMKDRTAAKLGAVFVREFKRQGTLKVLHTVPFLTKSVDDAILRKAGRHDYVATQDKALKETLKDAGVKVITLRGNHCVVEHK